MIHEIWYLDGYRYIRVVCISLEEAMQTYNTFNGLGIPTIFAASTKETLDSAHRLLNYQPVGCSH